MSTASAPFKSPPPPPLSIGSVGSQAAREQSGSDTFDNAILPESNTALSDSSSYCSTVFVNIGGAVSQTSPVLKDFTAKLVLPLCSNMLKKWLH
jgi:hypothetical protein